MQTSSKNAMRRHFRTHRVIPSRIAHSWYASRFRINALRINAPRDSWYAALRHDASRIPGRMAYQRSAALTHGACNAWRHGAVDAAAICWRVRCGCAAGARVR